MMLNCDPYQKSMSADMKVAIINRDAGFFESEIVRLSAIIVSRGLNKVAYDNEFSQLLVCMAYADMLLYHGETIQFVCDCINF